MNENVYLVRKPTYHGRKVIAIFATKGKAKEFKEVWDNHRDIESQIDEYRVDPTNWDELIKYDWEVEENE